VTAVPDDAQSGFWNMKRLKSPGRNLDAALRIPRLLCAGACVTVIFLCAASPAVAEETGRSGASSGDVLSRSTLTGDWGGARKRWEDNGVTFKPRLSTFYQGMSSGAGGHAYDFGGKADLQLDADFGTLGLIRGLSLTVHAEYNFGRNILGAGGTLMPVNTALTVPGMEGADAFDFSNVTFKQRFDGGASLMFGKISIVDYCNGKPFHGGEGIDAFWNIVFAAPPSGTVPAYFLGAILSVPTETVTYGLWVYDPNSSVNKPGIRDAFADGVTIRGSVSFPVSVGGLGGHQGVAASYSTKNGTDWETMDDVALGLTDTTGTKNDRWYLAYTVDQYLVRSKANPKEGIGLFGQLEISDGNPNYLHWMAFGGVGGTGMIPGRSLDNYGIGCYYAAFAEGLENLPPPNPQIRDERGFEAFYNCALTPWFILGADVQVIKASLTGETAVLPGLRTVVRF
jgi:porin